MSDIFDLTTKLKLEPKRSEQFCRCLCVFVVERTRMLECQDCQKVIDPFDYLMKQATKQQSTAFSIRNAKYEMNRLNGEVEELKRVKRNLQSQVNRLSKKTTTKGVSHG